MNIKFKGLERFEKRIMLATFLAGVTEVALGFSPLAPWIGKHLFTFGYLGIGLALLAVYHYLLFLIHRRNRK